MNNDLISRQAAIETILECCPSGCDNEYECGYDDGLRKGVHKLKHLPSAQPERKKGKWIEYVNSHCECPFCHKEWSFFENMTEWFNFCPNCGAEMEAEHGEVH